MRINLQGDHEITEIGNLVNETITEFLKDTREKDEDFADQFMTDVINIKAVTTTIECKLEMSDGTSKSLTVPVGDDHELVLDIFADVDEDEKTIKGLNTTENELTEGVAGAIVKAGDSKLQDMEEIESAFDLRNIYVHSVIKCDEDIQIELLDASDLDGNQILQLVYSKGKLITETTYNLKEGVTLADREKELCELYGGEVQE